MVEAWEKNLNTWNRMKISLKNVQSVLILKAQTTMSDDFMPHILSI